MTNTTTTKQNISFDQLLSYVDGSLSPECMAIIEQHLKESVSDQLVVKGIREFYKKESTDRQELESYISEGKKKLMKRL